MVGFFEISWFKFWCKVVWEYCSDNCWNIEFFVFERCKNVRISWVLLVDVCYGKWDNWLDKIVRINWNIWFLLVWEMVSVKFWLFY